MPPKQILVIEDETDIREMLVLRLKKERFQVLEASEGMLVLLLNLSAIILRGRIATKLRGG